MGSGLVELEGGVQSTHGVVGDLGSDHARDPDRRRGDHLDVDLSRPAPRTSIAVTPGWVFIPAPTSETCATSASIDDPVGAELEPEFLGHLGTRRKLVRRHREGDVGRAVHARCSARSCRRSPSRSARPRKSGAAIPGRSGTPVMVTLASASRWVTAETIACSMDRILLVDPGARLPGEARSDVQRHMVVASELDRAQRQHPATGGGDLEHFLEGDPGQLAAFGTTRGIGAEYPETSV